MKMPYEGFLRRVRNLQRLLSRFQRLRIFIGRTRIKKNKRIRRMMILWRDFEVYRDISTIWLVNNVCWRNWFMTSVLRPLKLNLKLTEIPSPSFLSFYKILITSLCINCIRVNWLNIPHSLKNERNNMRHNLEEIIMILTFIDAVSKI